MKVKVTRAGGITSLYLLVVAALSQSAAAQNCTQDAYYDTGTEDCQPCLEICRLSDDACRRHCPEFDKRTKAESCGKDSYYDLKVEACQPCREVCPSLDDSCSKLCPDMVTPTTPSPTLSPTTGGEMTNTTTWTTVLTSGTPPWLVWIIALIVILAAILGLIVFIMWYRGCLNIPTLGYQQFCSGEQGSANENTKTPEQETRVDMTPSPSGDSAAENLQDLKPRIVEVDDMDGLQNVLGDHIASPTTGHTNDSFDTQL